MTVGSDEGLEACLAGLDGESLVGLLGQGAQEELTITFMQEPRIEERDDAAVLGSTDQAADALAELHHGIGQGLLQQACSFHGHGDAVFVPACHGALPLGQ